MSKKIKALFLILFIGINNLNLMAQNKTSPSTKKATAAKTAAGIPAKKINMSASSKSTTPDTSTNPCAGNTAGPTDYCKLSWIDDKNSQGDKYDATAICDSSSDSGSDTPVTYNDFTAYAKGIMDLWKKEVAAANDFQASISKLSLTFNSDVLPGGKGNCMDFLSDIENPKYKGKMPSQCSFYVDDLIQKSKDLMGTQTELVDKLNMQNCSNIGPSSSLAKQDIQVGSQTITRYSDYPICDIQTAIAKMLNTQKFWGQTCSKFMTAAQKKAAEDQRQQNLQDQRDLQPSQPSEGQVWGQIIGGGVVSAGAFIVGQHYFNKATTPAGEIINKPGAWTRMKNALGLASDVEKTLPDFIKAVNVSESYAKGLGKVLDLTTLTKKADNLGNILKLGIDAEKLSKVANAAEVAELLSTTGKTGEFTGDMEKVASVLQEAREAKIAVSIASKAI